MKVFIYYSGFGNTGGPTTRARFYATELVRRGHEVTIGGLGRPWWRPASVGVAGVRYVGGLYVPKLPWFSRLGLVSPEMLCGRLVRHLRRERYDIVHCLGWTPITVHILSAGLASGAKTLYTVTGSGDRTYPDSCGEWWRFLCGIHSHCPSAVALAKDRLGFAGPGYAFPNGSTRVPVMIDRDPPNKFTVGFMGHLDTHKHVSRLLEVWRLLVRRLPQARLHLFGEGSLEKTLRGFVRQHGMNANVCFHGYQRDLYRIFSQFALLAVMVKEGMCNAALEALGMGREVFLPADGTFPELYGDSEAAHMFGPSASDEEVADLLVKVLMREDLLSERMKQVARSYFEENFSSQVIGDRLVACYEDLPRDSVGA